MSNMNLSTLMRKLTSRTESVEWLMENALIPRKKYCPKHKRYMTYLKESGKFGRFRCRKNKKYDHSVPVLQNTWFENSNISIGSCIMIAYGFAWRYTNQQFINECTEIEGETIPCETIEDRLSYCREVCTLAIDRDYAADGKIGGAECIVEIYECKIGQRKFQKGRLREGDCILGMIERGGEKYRLEKYPDNKRDAETFISLIQKYIEIGTEIHNDCWKGHLNLKYLSGYFHKTIDHSTNFVDPDSGAHTQNNESFWWPLSARLSRREVKEDALIDHLCEYLWRLEVKRQGADPFLRLLEDINLHSVLALIYSSSSNQKKIGKILGMLMGTVEKANTKYFNTCCTER